jgi:hypothetical protein
MSTAWDQSSRGLAGTIHFVCFHPNINVCCSECVQRSELIRTFIMDGNFSAEHMRSRTREAEIPLSAGMAFMANPDSYKAHLRTGKEIAQVCGILIRVPTLTVQ